MQKLNVLLFFLFTALFLSAQTPSKKILAIFAHPDDEQSIAPILVKYAEEGVEVTLVIATDGRLGVNQYNDYEAGDKLAAKRREEMSCAAETLGVDLIHLNYHDQLKAAEGFDGHIPHVQQLILDLKKIVTDIKPDVIITWGPDGATTHMDHRLVGASVTQVFVSQTWSKPMNLYYFGIPSDFLPDENSRTLRGQDRNYLTTQIPFTEAHFNQAYRALLCHESQYPATVVANIKKERAKMGSTLFLRKFQVPNNIEYSLF
jgi:LmbE family N-acetylglucosaminyl deacetylase